MTASTCPPDHKHGASTTCYTGHRCRCDHCRAGHNARAGRRRKEIAYGRYNRQLVDAGPVRDHIAWLRSQGLGVHGMQQASGVSSRTIAGIMWGRLTASRELILPAKVRPHTAAKILAIKPRLELLAPHAYIDARGTVRRMRALATLGWSNAELARRLGRGEYYLQRASRAHQVTAETARIVSALYDELWDQKPPARTATQRAMIRRTQARAKALRWVSPLGWDDIDDDESPASVETDPDDVDVIAIDLAIHGTRVRLTTAERHLAVQQLVTRHHNDQEIAAMLGCSAKTITRDRATLHLPAAVGPDRRAIAA